LSRFSPVPLESKHNPVQFYLQPALVSPFLWSCMPTVYIALVAAGADVTQSELSKLVSRTARSVTTVTWNHNRRSCQYFARATVGTPVCSPKRYLIEEPGSWIRLPLTQPVSAT
jgi:hypothetical protein